jgi:hypothetical protein
MIHMKMKILLSSLLLSGALLAFGSNAQAHQSGCHRWHSCPSDTGSYVCGDTGYCSGCPNNQYCKNGTYSPTPVKKVVEVVKPKAVVPSSFVGAPKTYTQLYSCLVVGNGSSKIYHLKGSRWIKEMNLKDKYCFKSEADAKVKGYRKSRN